MKHIIIGGDAAGMSAAMQIRRLNHNDDITVFEMGNILSYAQCGMPYYISGKIPEKQNLIARTEKAFNEKYNIKTRCFHEVTSIIPAEKKVLVKDIISNERNEYFFDKLLIATGASAIKPTWSGVDNEGVFCLKKLNDADQIKTYIENSRLKNAVIIGGGYIGLEMTETFLTKNINVTLIEKTNQVGGSIDKDISERLEEYLQDKITLKLGEEVKEIQKLDNQLNLITDKNIYPTDIIVIAVGIKPNSLLAVEAGIDTGVSGAIQVNRQMETNIPGLYAAGDCAVHYHLLKNRDDYIPLGTTANKQGRIAGENMAGKSSVFKGIIGSSIFKVLDLEVGRTGLNEKEAKLLNLDYMTVAIEALDHAHYYPNAKNIFLKILYDTKTRQILGGQFLGENKVDKQLDILAAVIFNSMKIDEINQLDLSYAPPFSTVWSPIQQASSLSK